MGNSLWFQPIDELVIFVFALLVRLFAQFAVVQCTEIENYSENFFRLSAIAGVSRNCKNKQCKTCSKVYKVQGMCFYEPQ